MRRRRPYYCLLSSSSVPCHLTHFILFLLLLSILVRGLVCDEDVSRTVDSSNKLNSNNNGGHGEYDDSLKPLDVKDLLSRLSTSSNDDGNNHDQDKRNDSQRSNVAVDDHTTLKHAPHRHHNKPNHQRAPDFDSELIVNTQNGLVRGKAVYLDYHLHRNTNSNNSSSSSYSYPYGKKKFRVNAWLGIPFGEKPIGKLRFKRPVPVKNWNGVFNATELPNSCYQLIDTVITEFDGVDMWNPNTNISEDCLYLNIWTPHPRPRNAAVMVWIYGGGFIAGTSTLKVYDPRIIVAETQVIFVSIQYRISVFGFLYMNHEDAPGNQGLIDQSLALKWIQNNIQYFGGDSSKITIFGESAGSVSVSLHLLSPLSSNLFHNAIMESGTALADWALLSYEDAMERNSGILQHFGCNITNVTEAIECAREIDPKTAIEKADEYFYSKAIHGVAQFTFLPVVDSYFLEEEPISMLNRGKFKKCPILLGGNRDEGNWLFVYAFPEYRNLTVRPAIDYDTFKDFVTSLYYFYPQFPAVSSKAVLNAILYRYTNWQNVNNNNRNFENLDDAAGDFHFVCPTLDFANIYAMHRQDVFFYYYTQRSSRHYWPEWLGVMHGDEISFVFGEPLYPELNYTYEEKILTRKILKYWSNFAKYSDPNGPPKNPNNNNNNNEYGRTDADYYRTAIKPSEQRLKAIQNRYRANASSSLSPVISTQTMLQTTEFWPKYKIDMNPYSDEQRAYLNLNSRKVEVGYNLRAEYCAFWGTFLPTLMLSEHRCGQIPFKLQSSAAIHFSSSLYNLFSLTAYLVLVNRVDWVL